jgi:hypothetical protein
MTETSPEPASPPPAAGGPLTRAENWFRGHAGHAEADAAAFAADVTTALRGHASAVLRGTADAIDVLKLIDPADADLFSAAEALVPELLGMAESAARIAGAALKST